jgi:hypothetical protein
MLCAVILCQMLDVPPAYFYTQPGAMGPGMYDNLAPQDWQVRVFSGDALLPWSLAAHGSERGDQRLGASGARRDWHRPVTPSLFAVFPFRMAHL